MTKPTDPVEDLVADTLRGYEKVASPAALGAIRAALYKAFTTHPVMSELIAEELARKTLDEVEEKVRDAKRLAELEAKRAEKDR